MISDDQPLVSIIMPAYNAEKYIGEAIESILKQTYSKIELIIIEDYSTDSTLSVIENYLDDERIHLFVNEENKGIAFSTNMGIENSNGKYIALMDDDDISMPNRIELQVQYMESHLDIDIIGTGSANIDQNGKIISYHPIPKYNPKLYKAILLFGSVGFCNGSAMIRKDFIRNNNLRYRDNCLGMQDFRFYIDAVLVGNISSIKDVLYYYRKHNSNETIRQSKMEKRKKLFAEFQKISFENHGFQLTDLQMMQLSCIVNEDSKDKHTLEEYIDLYNVLKKLLQIARELQIDYYEELKYWCMQVLGEKLKNIVLFD